MSELSNLLQKARLDKKLTLKEVSKATRVIETYLNLIEEGNFRELPSYIHAYGFVKKYAEYLGFDYSKDIEPLFSQEYPKPSITETLHQVENKQNSLNSSSDEEVFTIENERLDDSQDVKGKSTFTKVLLVLVILALGIYGGYLLYKNNNSNAVENSGNTIIIGGDTEEDNTYSYSTTVDDTDNDTVEDEYGTTETVEDNVTPERMVDPLLGVDNSIPQEPENTIQTVTVRFSEDCWFKYSSDLNGEREYNAKRGGKINIEFNKEFSITMGNAIAVSLHYKDQYLGNFGERDSAKFNVRYILKDGKLVYARNNY